MSTLAACQAAARQATQIRAVMAAGLGGALACAASHFSGETPNPGR
jgi:hypothetical protein